MALPRGFRAVHDHVMRAISSRRFIVGQLVIVLAAIVAYFGVRGLTEGDPSTAHDNAELVLSVERAVGLDIEQRIQQTIGSWEVVVTLSNWVYIWLHWPVVAFTLIWLARADRRKYLELRNAMIISGLIGLVIFAAFPVAPPRLFGAEYVDTVTERSYSYRVLQPPAFVNAYAAVPSLHFGWNLLVGVMWYKVARGRGSRPAAVIMPVAMAWAVVATANHWVFDVIAGGAVALCGLAIERRVARPPTVSADESRTSRDLIDAGFGRDDRPVVRSVRPRPSATSASTTLASDQQISAATTTTLQLRRPSRRRPDRSGAVDRGVSGHGDPADRHGGEPVRQQHVAHRRVRRCN